MTASELIDLHFDKGNGAIFAVEFSGQIVNCFVGQDNEFFNKIATSRQSFPDIFERHIPLVALAARISIETKGISSDIWGNEITCSDLETAHDIRDNSPR